MVDLSIDIRGDDIGENGFRLAAEADRPPLSWRPGSVTDTLTLFIQEDKTGSSSIRNTLESSAKAGIGCLIGLKKWKTGQRGGAARQPPHGNCSGSAILFNANFGDCVKVAPQPCQYLTMLREPVDRMVSEYNCAHTARTAVAARAYYANPRHHHHHHHQMQISV